MCETFAAHSRRIPVSGAMSRTWSSCFLHHPEIGQRWQMAATPPPGHVQPLGQPLLGEVAAVCGSHLCQFPKYAALSLVGPVHRHGGLPLDRYATERSAGVVGGCLLVCHHDADHLVGEPGPVDDLHDRTHLLGQVDHLTDLLLAIHADEGDEVVLLAD